MTATQSSPMGEQELIALAEELREYTAMKYAGDCKCGKCQLVPRALVDRLYSALRAAASPRLADKWQPISTAPRDGRMALVYRPLARNSGDEPIAIKRLVKGNQHCWDSTVPAGAEPFNPTDGSCHVTHWQPLEPPPEVTSQDRQTVENAGGKS